MEDAKDPCEAVVDEMVKHLSEEPDDKRFGVAALEALSHGVPICYRDDAYPGEMVKMYPDGRREIIDLDENYNEVVVREIPKEYIDIEAELRRAKAEEAAFNRTLDQVWRRTAAQKTRAEKPL